jgi:hypothetical protein
MSDRKSSLLLALGALVVALFLAEGLLRVAVEPVDYLLPDLVRDSVLRWRVEASSAGHDRWGYRNRHVPDSVDVVTLGDSQTYGNGALASASWPAWLERETGLTVYNLGLAGYGPLDYRFLAETRIDSLRPRLVVVGLYLGNDLIDAYRSVYSRDHWRHLRGVDEPDSRYVADPQARLPNQPAATRGLGVRRLKAWLGRHFVLYAAVAAAGRNSLRAFARETFTDWDPDVWVLRDSDGDLLTAVNPNRSRALDRTDQTVLEGLRLTLAALETISELCLSRKIDYRVVLIPTKPRVYWEALPDARKSDHRAAIELLVANETVLTSEIKSWLADRHMVFSDPLADLIEAARYGVPIYPRTEDGHPSGEGYRIIASVVARDLR